MVTVTDAPGDFVVED